MGLADAGKNFAQKKKSLSERSVTGVAAASVSTPTVALISSGAVTITPVSQDFESVVELLVDQVYQEVVQKKVASLEYLSSKFKVDLHQLEQWAVMLDSEGLLELRFPLNGKPELRSREDLSVVSHKKEVSHVPKKAD